MASTLSATLLKTKLTIHGEEHSNIDNAYYEALPLTGLLFVEHSNNASEIKPSEEHLFKKYAKGSEWVFYTQKKRGNPNVICFDTRSEQGYLNSFEARQLLETADKLAEGKPADIRFFIDNVMKSLNALDANKHVFNQEYYEKSYDILEGQLKAVMKLLKIRKEKGITTTVLGMPLKDLLPGLAYSLACNLQRIASVGVDMGLMRALLEFAKKNTEEIQIFCGKNHLIRMTKFLPLKNLKISGITQSNIDDADINMNGDPDIDKQILLL